MPFLCFLGTLIALLVATASEPPARSTETPDPSASGPRLKLSQDSWNFGTARHLEHLETTVQLSNIGNAELQISNVSSSCGCTAAQPEKRRLLPGESTPLKITFNTRGKQGSTTANVTIESNDKSEPKKIFRVEGEVKRVIQVEPEFAVFRLLSPDEQMSTRVHVVNTTPQPMQLKLQEYASGKFTAELKEIRSGQEYDIVITTKPPITQRRMADMLRVTTGLEDEPRLEISTQVQQIDRVNFLQPALLVVGERNETLEASGDIEYFGNDPAFRVTKAECADSHVAVRFSEPFAPEANRPGRKPTSIVKFVAQFPPQVVFPPGGLPIRVYTTDPEYPTLTIYATTDAAEYRDLTARARNQSQRKTP